MSSSKSVALVTGCSKGGIGFAFCEELAARGCVVYATARRLEAMQDFSHENIHLLTLDVTSDDNVRDVVNTIIEREGQIDILVNNAGVGTTGPVIDVPMEDIIGTFNTNVFSVIRMAKAVIPHMASRKSGTIVNMGSILGEIPIPWGGIYAATKAAMHTITDTLYMECTPFNINVFLVCPGGVTSNIANNHRPRVKIPENTLYADYIDSIMAKLEISQGPKSMPTKELAQRVVAATLSPKPPRYMTLAANSMYYRIFKWLPRGWVLRMFWDRFGAVDETAAEKKRK
ncbi:NAD-P-binding protein [Lenzites betulinus]|nr:NAD-P-binding protein [Lenzites betulinus]